jgi:hypothetical protein
VAGRARSTVCGLVGFALVVGVATPALTRTGDSAVALPPGNPALDAGLAVPPITFPVPDSTGAADDFLAPRDGGRRRHQGNDVFGSKGDVVVAVRDATVVSVRLDAGGLSGNSVTLRDADGFTYFYAHLNNDTLPWLLPPEPESEATEPEATEPESETTEPETTTTAAAPSTVADTTSTTATPETTTTTPETTTTSGGGTTTTTTPRTTTTSGAASTTTTDAASTSSTAPAYDDAPEPSTSTTDGDQEVAGAQAAVDEFDDGANDPSMILIGDLRVGSRVTAGQPIAYLGDSGNAENTTPHVHFEIRAPGGHAIDPHPALQRAHGVDVHGPGERCAATSNPTWTPVDGPGYALATAGVDPTSPAGGWVGFSADTPPPDPAAGPTTTTTTTTAPPADAGATTTTVVAPAPRPVLRGGAPVLPASSLALPPAPGADPVITVVPSSDVTAGSGAPATSDGGDPATADGDGKVDLGLTLPLPVPVTVEPTPDGTGGWTLWPDGRIDAWGRAPDRDDTSHVALRAPVVDLVAAADGGGYLVLAADGGVFAYGTAFPGSAVDLLVGDERAVAIDVAGTGAWVLTDRGRVLPLGGAPVLGDVAGVGRCSWPDAVDLAAAPAGDGYWILTVDGQVWAFGSAPWYGDLEAWAGLPVTGIRPLVLPEAPAPPTTSSGPSPAATVAGAAAAGVVAPG